MSAIAVNVRRVAPGATQENQETDLATARWLADLLDTKFSIGGFRFGIDPIVDLVPVLGDTLMFIAGMYPLHLARKYQLPKRVQWRMIGNLVIDYIIGIIPIIGALFDAAYKANVKNVALLERALRNR
jgi:hypothetical protein